MAETKIVSIVLGHHSANSRVLVDGIDITTSIRGLDIRAFAGEPSRITLTLSPHRVEISGEVSELLKAVPPDEEFVCASCGQPFGHAKNCGMPNAPRVRRAV